MYQNRYKNFNKIYMNWKKAILFFHINLIVVPISTFRNNQGLNSLKTFSWLAMYQNCYKNSNEIYMNWKIAIPFFRINVSVLLHI